eukprot:CCRYP_018694-RD/>CCRYP_018694-RD protein AED:0.05 eAED:0.20 QI:0/0.33/0.42/1/0.66/0.71/7/398/3423
MDPSEALSILPFATLSAPDGAGGNKKPSAHGRMTLCAPSSPCPQLRGVAFRFVDGQQVVQAVLISPPSLPQASDVGGDEEGHVEIDGGAIVLLGSFAVQRKVMRIACTPDGRLVLLGGFDGSLLCLDALFNTHNNLQVGSVQFTKRWECSLHSFMNSIHGVHGLHYDVQYNPDGSMIERRWSEENPDSSREAVENQEGGAITTMMFKFHSLEFIRHSFLAVVEWAGETKALWMDASTLDVSSSLNYWPLSDADFENDNADEIKTQVTCASARPLAEAADILHIAVGTNKGTVGILESSSTGKKMNFVEHPLFNLEEEENPNMPLWQVSHLHWFTPSSLAVGFTRVIVDMENEEDEDEEDDPNEHQANFLVASIDSQEDSPLDSLSWTWSELGDVVPFFSIPNGGRHAFHTVALPCNPSPSSMLLVGCNVGSDVVLLSEQNGGWSILDLAEGHQMMCPTDEDDEFLYLMGLTVVMLSLISPEGQTKLYPFPMLASTDGRLSTFAPYYRGIGQDYFSRLSEGGDDKQQSWDELCSPIIASSVSIASFLPMTTAERHESNNGVQAEPAGKCILSGLDLGLDQVENEAPAGRGHDDASDSDDSDYQEDDLKSSSDELDGPTDAEKEEPKKPPAFGSGFTAPSFTFAQPSFSFQPSSTASTMTPPKAGLGSGSIAGGFSFGSTGGATFGSPSTLGGPTLSTVKQPREPGSSASVFGSTSASTAFGTTAFSTFGGFIGFGDIKQSSASSGFGDDNQSKPQQNDKALMPTKKDIPIAPPFGSATEPPSFSFGSATEGFASGNDAGMNQGVTTKSNQSEAFGKSGEFGSSSTLSITHKNLFENRKNVNKLAPNIEEETTNLLKTAPGEKASKVFQSVLAATEGCDSYLHAFNFATLIDEIGEGFHGDELEHQLSLVDPSQSGKIERNAFIKWYCDLVNKKDDESSNDSEVAEERDNAANAFVGVARVDSDSILASDFGKLIESLGTTYCEEEHLRTIKKISTLDSSSGDRIITKKAFVDWYVEWLFGDGDSESVGEGSGDESEPYVPNTSDATSGAEGWGSRFKASEEGRGNVKYTAKAGEEGSTPVTGSATATPSVGSIGAGGFSFGVTGSGGIGAGGFSFVAPAPAAEAPKKETRQAEKDSSLATTVISSGGFTFGATEVSKTNADKSAVVNQDEETTNPLKTAPGEKASKVFQSVLAATEGCDSYLHAFNFATLIDEIGEGFHGDELEHQLSLVDPSQSGKIERNAFIKWYCDLVNKKDDESSNDSEVAEERDNAANAFVGVAGVDSDSILASDFGKLIESLGTTYCEEEHLRTIKKISTLDSSSGDRIITKKAFVDWYVEWLFGDGDSESVGEGSGDESEPYVPNTSDATSGAEGWGSRFKASEEGSWKCEVCMVTNAASAKACAACETAKAGEEGSTPVTGSATATPSVGSIGAGGFSFGVTGSGGIGAGGFSFVAPAPAAEAPKKETRQAEKDSSLATTVISSGGFTFGATEVSKTNADKSAVVNQDEETTNPLKTAPGEKASKVFQSVLAATEGCDSYLHAFNFATLIDEIGEGFHGDELEHQLSLVDPSQSGKIERNAFIKWYCDLVNKKDDESSNDSELAEERDNAANAFGWGSRFKASEEGSWKCEVCMVTNAASAKACAACETAKAGEEGSTPVTGSATATPSVGSIGAGGFSFGVTGSGGIGAGGFSFVAPAPAAEASKKETRQAEKDSSLATTVISSGGFTFGATGAYKSSKDQESKASSSGATFPPMSASAPKPLSSSAASSGSGFPPMSASSPTPFSSFGAKKEASVSSSISTSFPPMSAIAPKPFGSAASAPKKEEESKPASSGAAFPPMSASAPKPFSSSAASSGSGFPPVSAASPTPFSSFCAKKEASASSSMSSSFPPMSAIAPKPFGSATSAPKKEEENKPASSGAAFPPMSASAAKLFSSSAASSGSGFPHMSASSPTPFSSFGAKKEASASSSTSSSFPPMSAIAPKPFGSAASAPKKEEESKRASSGAAFPPMSASAPKPFSSSAASSGSGFPHMSASSPTPFSSFGAKEEASASSSTSSSFPPMSAIAPKPFGSAASAPKKEEESKPASSGAAFPPMSASAPKPFSSSAASSGSGFPHMSASSPTPFSSFGAKEEASASSSMSSSFPPMSAIAPKPFGSAASAPKKEEESKPASSGAAFPPMSASAPKPFSSSAASPGSGFPPVSASSPTPFSSFGAKKEASASSSMSSSFPPMSAIAPKPFGSAACAPKKKEENKPASSGAAFPPTSASAAKPFSSSAASPGSGFPHMSASSPTPFSSFGAKKEASASSSMSSSFPPMSAIAPKPFGSAASAFPKPFSMSIINQEKQAAPSAIVSISSYVVFSNYEKQLWEQVSQFRNSLYDARCLPVNPKTSIIESKIEKVTHHCQERISFADQLSELNADIRNRLVYLFSVEDDLLRQHKAAKNSINDQISKKDHSFTARNEPLDAEAEMKRRGILSKCIDVQNLLLMTKQCLSLNTEIFSSSSNHHQEPLRPSEYFNQWSFPKPSSRRQTSLTANNAIFRSLTAQYDRARDLHSSSETLQQSVSSLSESAKHSARLTPVSRTKRAPTSASVRRSISPLPTKHFVSSLNKKTPSTISSIVGQNSLMRDIISALQSHPCNSAKLFYLAKRRSSTRSIGIPDWKSKGKNELMPSSRPPATKVVHNTSPVAKTLFSSPIAGRKARAEWSTKSASASSTLQFNIPKNLQEINVTDAAKAALACQGRDIISRDHLDSSTEKMSSFTHVVPKAASGLSSSSPSAFPPMSSAAPKPLSQGTVKQSSLDPHGLKSASIEDKKSPTDYEEVLKKFFKVNAPEKLGDVDQYLQKYSGKEAEMFVALAKKYEQPNALNEVFLSRLPSVDKNNNLALLTLFLQVFNPARSGEASNLISKYKGKESEMFASLSRKYYACNPLQSFKTSSSTKTEAFETKETCAVFPPMSLSPPNPPTGIGKKDDCGSDAKPRTKESSSAFLSLSALGPKPLAAISECDDSKESKSHPLSPKEEQSSSKEKADTFSFGGMFSSGSSPFGGAGTASVSSSASTAKAGIPTFPTSSRSSQSSTHHKDYHKILTDFYQKHNPAKVSEVNNNLQKYKGKEAEMFSKLAQKYNAKNPLESDTPQEGAQSSGSFGGFASTFSSAAKSPSPFTSSSANQSSSPFGGKVDEGKPKSPFSSYGAQASTPFENASKTPFGTSGTAPAAPFGSAGFSNDGFGSTTAAGAGLLSQGSTTFSSSPFGSTNTTTLASGPSSNKFGGQNPRELLLSFYQTHNPSKLGEVDKTLAKYAGKEELMFLNLARKYNVDPAMFGVNASNASTTPPASGFGCSTAPTFGSQAVQGSSFGTPSFGSPAVLGGGVSGSSGNGGSITAGFGGFSGSSGTTFGSLAASNASPFSGAPCPAFSGVTTPFGAARR